MTDELEHSPLRERQSGILLHPTSLPGPWGIGDMGDDAYRFVDFLVEAGQRIWQILPLGPTHGDNSPYQCLSAHAGNPLLISIEALARDGLLDGEVVPRRDPAHKQQWLQQAFSAFRRNPTPALHEEFGAFVESQAHWLEDFALYRVIKELQEGRAWFQWPAELRDHDADTMARLCDQHDRALAFIRFEQFVFFRQWLALKAYANERGVKIFGDLPIFVAHDSADVWARREGFALDEQGQPTVVAGVPPDYFSATGQRWGNPHYDWEWMEADGFRWWMERVETQLALFDLVRIDHFRGFEAYWEVPAHEETAMNGRWVKAPGDRLFNRLRERFDPLPVVAEDLGIITDEVTALRRRYALPGMKILQFAFDGGAANPYLPHNHEVNCVVYTGTHDNDTTMGWFNGLSDEQRGYVLDYLCGAGEDMPWPLIKMSLASVARLAVLPFQDVLALDTEHRMNVPGVTEGNWTWRFDWDMVPEGLTERLRHLAAMYGRLP